MIEHDPSETIPEFVIPTTKDLVERYLALSDEDKELIHKRATYLRNGPTGMNDAEAIIAAMAESVSLEVKD